MCRINFATNVNVSVLSLETTSLESMIIFTIEMNIRILLNF